MVNGYTKTTLENRVAEYYEGLYAETFPTGGAKRPVSIVDLEPMLRAFEHRIRGEGLHYAPSQSGTITSKTANGA